MAQSIPEKYSIIYHFADKDSSFKNVLSILKNNFTSRQDAIKYLEKLTQFLNSNGFASASVDSAWEENNKINILLYTGKKYNWTNLKVSSVDAQLLETIGYKEYLYKNNPTNFESIEKLKQDILNYYENNGHPFANVYLDSAIIQNESMSAALKVDKGIIYTIDSLRVFGKINIRRKFLQKFLSISNGSLYNKQKLMSADKRLSQLSYLTVDRPSDVSMLGSGAILNLYLKERKSSRFNFIIGILPASTLNDKLQVTGDINLDLKNLLGTGESFLLKWQSLQPKSPRLNIGYDQPYIFNLPFGVNLLFDLFKKDSNFVQVNAQAGLQFLLSNTQTGKIFTQIQNNSLLQSAIDTIAIKAQNALPLNVDVSSINTGLEYGLQNTNYKFNPRKGNEIYFVGSAGIKKIKKNNQILEIKDPNFDANGLYNSVKSKAYQIKFTAAASQYFPLGKSATVKAAINTGLYTSPNIFRNELFQIGGYRLLRGFSEESIYASKYAVFTTEYRYLLSQNSYMFTFIDFGLVQNKFQNTNVKSNYAGTGLGMLYETKLGLLNISFALGKRSDIPFNLSSASKIHFGYINYF